jgi:hypothetical protein
MYGKYESRIYAPYSRVLIGKGITVTRYVIAFVNY